MLTLSALQCRVLGHDWVYVRNGRVENVCLRCGAEVQALTRGTTVQLSYADDSHELIEVEQTDD